ncbi:CoA pyrophosphatase [Paraglaciecola aquimarina]|uniref:CoA pyrophosphatase n=1 Tax=Paraglaciecola algarum TaxID=3050085 RepID=A0ABS9D157_9ALTE|nr:CoA pyrophosphatase [Paraglaciecola sp. G1-23]MCF2946596.1 CoA pyrophosphatase [Paraglaciecola sp. G1-23]
MNKTQFLNQFQHAKIIQHDADYPLKTSGRPAAVLLPIIEYSEQLSVLFTLRAKHLKHHGGQISFPGGKQETSDSNLLDTALRETAEEVGIQREQIDIIGQLPVYRTITGFEVTPYIGFVTPTSKLILDENEVHSTFEVPLEFLIDQTNHFVHMVNRKNIPHPVYFIPWQEHNIWGATAAFVRTLSNHLQHT